ncbi:MAG: GIY-YIG nuclease family protein [Hyphomicrobiaceae bacterium]
MALTAAGPGARRARAASAGAAHQRRRPVGRWPCGRSGGEVELAIVYLLTSPVMPGLVKIGCTERAIEDRMRELAASSAVPLPFECFLAVDVGSEAAEVERALHEAFADKRLNPRREFFELSPDRPAAVLRLFVKRAPLARDVTPSEDVVSSREEQNALDRERERRGSFRFSQVGILPGSLLTSVFDPKFICTVLDDRAVDFRGQRTNLSSAALQIAHETGRNWKSVRGPQFWTYEGRSLVELRDETENDSNL